MDNPSKYGFRYYGGTGGVGHLKPILKKLATALEFDVTGGIQNAVLQAGDVVALTSTGTIAMCAGNETTPAMPYGVVVGGIEYFDTSIGQAGAMRKATYLPSAISWGTIESRASRCLVMPFMPGQLWEVDVDDATTFTTEAAYRDAIGENVEFINTGAAGSTPAWIRPKLDISTNATTATLFFRIAGISDTHDNYDFSGANVKLLVEANIASSPAYGLVAAGNLGV